MRLAKGVEMFDGVVSLGTGLNIYTRHGWTIEHLYVHSDIKGKKIWHHVVLSKVLEDPDYKLLEQHGFRLWELKLQ